MTKISVIVPIYNVEKYIAQCVHSLFRQTLRNVEYIFVDDCSLDHSIDILQKIIAEYPDRMNQITIIRKDQNEGLPLARKTGFEKSTGEYIIHIDSDDWIEDDMLQILYDKAFDNDLDLVWCDYIEDNLNQSKRINTNANELEKIAIIKMILKGSLHSGVWNKLVKKNIYINNKVKFANDNQLEDMVLTMQNVFYSNNYGYVNKALYHYRINQNSLTLKKSFPEKKSIEMYNNFLTIFLFLDKKFNENIYLLEPELSNCTNQIKARIMRYNKTRDRIKLFKLNPRSNDHIFNKTLKLPFYHKLILYTATHRNYSIIYNILEHFFNIHDKIFNYINI
jgi:glycosyltransferase involved in cell wall biosynthesis